MFTNRDSCLLRTACGVLFFSTYIVYHINVNEKSIFNEHFVNSCDFGKNFLHKLFTKFDRFIHKVHNLLKIGPRRTPSVRSSFTNCLQIKVDLFTIAAQKERGAISRPSLLKLFCHFLNKIFVFVIIKNVLDYSTFLLVVRINVN